MSVLRRVATASAVALLVAGLAACASPDPREARDAASAVFDDLVAAAASVDTAVLRTLETDDPAQLACDRPAGAAQTAFTARGTLSVGADDADAAVVVAAVAAHLEEGRWDPLRSAASHQSAWVDRAGTVATVTAEGPVIAIAVFTPCLVAG